MIVGIVFRYLKNFLGVVGVFFGGVVMSWVVVEEGVNFGLGFYKFNCMDINFRFLDWWEWK